MSTLTENDVRAALHQLPQTTGDPRRREELIGMLRDWRTHTLEAERRNQALTFERMFSDPETLGGVWDPAKPEVANALRWTADPIALKAQTANIAFLARRTGRSPDEIARAYEVHRDDFALANFQGRGLGSDTGFFTAAAAQVEQEKHKRILMGGTPAETGGTDSLALAASKAALLGRDRTEAWAEWQKSAAGMDGWNPRELGDYGDAWRAVYNRQAEQGRKLQGVADILYNQLAMQTGVREGEEDPDIIRDTARVLAGLPRKDREFLYGMLAARAEAEGVDQKGFWKQMGESFVRGGQRITNEETWDRSTLMGVMAQMREGNPFFGVPVIRSIAPGLVGDQEQGFFEVTEENLPALESAIEEKWNLLDVLDDLNSYANGTIDPIVPLTTGLLGAMEKGMYGFAGSVPYMAVLAIPLVGPVITYSSTANDIYNQYRRAHPTIDREDAMQMAAVAAVPHVLLERIQLRMLSGRLPGFASYLNKLSKPTTSMARAFGMRVGPVAGLEFGTELAQDALVPAFQGVVAALSEDVPGVDWQTDFAPILEHAPETFFAVLPLALIGSGVASWRDVRASEELVGNRSALLALGLSEEQAGTVLNAEGIDAKVSALREVMPKRERAAESVREGIAQLQAQMQEARESIQTAEGSGALPGMTRTQHGWRVNFPETDGVEFGTWEEAHSARMGWMDRQESTFADETLEAVEFFEQRMRPGETIETREELKSLGEAVESGGVDIDVARERLRIAALADGTASSQESEAWNSYILGETEVSTREGTFQATMRLNRGGGILDIAEERVEASAWRMISDGRRGWLADRVREWEDATGDRLLVDQEAPSDLQVVEAVSAMGRAYLVSRRRDSPLQGLRPQLRAMLRAVREWVMPIMRRAYQMGKLRREGKLDAELEAFLEDSLGLSEQRTYEQGVAEEAVREAGIDPSAPGQAGASFSISRVTPEQDAEYLAAVSRGDMETAQRMVDAAAKAAGYDSDYHYRGLNPNVGDVLLSNENSYLTDDIGVAQEYATNSGGNSGVVQTVFYRSDGERAVIRNLEDALELAEEIGVGFDSDYVFEWLDKDEVRDALVESGYTSVEFEDQSPQTYSEHQAVLLLPSGQIKSADPVTYDESGNVIPLSQRFNPADDRISYSLSSSDYINRVLPAIDAAMRNPERRRKQMLRVREKALAQLEKWAMTVEDAETRGQRQRAGLLGALRTLDAMTIALPPELRGKIGGVSKLASLKTDDSRLKHLAEKAKRIADVVEEALRQEYLAEFEALVDRARPTRDAGKKPKGKIGPEAHAIFDKVEAAALMTEVEAERRETELIASIETESDPAVNADLVEEWHIVRMFGAFEEQTIEHMDAAIEWLTGVYEAGRNRWRAVHEARAAEIRELRETAIQESGGQGGPERTQARKTIDRAVANAVDGFMTSLFSFQQTLKDIFGDGKTMDAWDRRARQATREKRAALLKRKDDYREAMFTIFGTRKWRVAQKRIQALGARQAKSGVFYMKGRTVREEKIEIEAAQRILDGTTPHDFSPTELTEIETKLDAILADPTMRPNRRWVRITRTVDEGTATEIPLSQLEALHLRMLMAQEQYQDGLAEIGFGEDTRNQLAAFLKPETLAVGDWLAAQYADGWAPLNRVFQRMYGVALPRLRNYAPGTFEAQQVEGGPSNLDPMSTGIQTGSMRAGFIKTRKKHRAMPRMEDALNVYWSHVAQVEHWIHFAELTRDLRSTFAHVDARSAVEANAGQASKDHLLRWVDALENEGVKQAWTNRSLMRWMSRVQGAIAQTALAYNVGVLMKQSTAMFAAGLDIPQGDFIRGWGRFMRGNKALAMPFFRILKSDLIRNRMQAGFSPEVQQALAAADYQPSLFQDFVRFGLDQVGNVDAFFTAFSATIAYDYHYRQASKAGLGETMAHAEALRRAEATVARTAQPVEVADRSLFEMSLNPMARLFFMFLSEVRQKFAIEYLAGKRALQGRADPGELRRVLVMNHVVMPLVFQTMSNLWRDLIGDDDDGTEDDPYWEWEDYVRAMLVGPVSGVLFVGEAIEALVSKALGQRPWENLRNPVMDGLTDVVRIFESGPDRVADLRKPGASKEEVERMVTLLNSAARGMGQAIGGDWAALGVGANIAKQIFGAADNWIETDAEKAIKARAEARRLAKEARESAPDR